MDGRLPLTNCDEAGDYVVPNVLSPRNLVSRRDKMDETVLSSSSSSHTVRKPVFGVSDQVRHIPDSSGLKFWI